MLYLRLGIFLLITVGGFFFREHYIEVGREEVRAAVKIAGDAEAQRQKDAHIAALQDALARVDQLTKANSDLEAALNSSEVLNHAEADNTCLSDARRLRIDAVR